MSPRVRIKDLIVRTIAIPTKGSLRHGHGKHPGRMVLTLVEVETDQGVSGFGEAGGGGFSLEWIFRVLRSQLVGEDAMNIRRLRWKVAHVATSRYYNQILPQAWFAIETALLDAVGRVLGVPANVLLGGSVRESVDVAGYVFPMDGLETPEDFLKYGKGLVSTYGFKVLKLKAGVYLPEHEVDVVRLMASELAGVRFRVDPNGAWRLSDAVRVARGLAGVDIEYFEDPVWTVEGMRSFREKTGEVVATNTIATRFEDIPHAFLREAVDIILGDPHWYYGSQGFLELASLVFNMGLELGMHSPGESGVGFAAMIHAASCAPNLAYAIDTHYIHLEDDILKTPIRIEGGRVRVPTSPGLGVEVDLGKVEKYEALYREKGDYIYHGGDPEGGVRLIPSTGFLRCRCHKT